MIAAAVVAGGCWCGDEVPGRCTNLTGSKDICTYKCKGNSSEICGGNCVVSAYRFKCEEAPPAPAPPPVAPVTPPQERGVALRVSGGLSSCTVSVWQLAL